MAKAREVGVGGRAGEGVTMGRGVMGVGDAMEMGVRTPWS